MGIPLDRVPRYVAIHEAGHALAYILLNEEECEPFRRVIVRTARESNEGPFIDFKGRECNVGGMVEGIEVNGHPMYWRNIGRRPPYGSTLMRRWRDELKKGMVAAYAGPIAEVRYRRIGLFDLLYENETIGSDAAQIDAAVWCLTGNNELSKKACALRKRTLTDARRMVNANWSKIVAIADNLVVKRCLTVNEVRAIVRHDNQAAFTNARRQ